MSANKSRVTTAVCAAFVTVAVGGSVALGALGAFASQGTNVTAVPVRADSSASAPVSPAPTPTPTDGTSNDPWD